MKRFSTYVSVLIILMIIALFYWTFIDNFGIGADIDPIAWGISVFFTIVYIIPTLLVIGIISLIFSLVRKLMNKRQGKEYNKNFFWLKIVLGTLTVLGFSALAIYLSNPF